MADRTPLNLQWKKHNALEKLMNTTNRTGDALGKQLEQSEKIKNQAILDIQEKTDKQQAITKASVSSNIEKKAKIEKEVNI